MATNYQILVVDDDVEDHLILSEYFDEFGIGDVVRFVTNGKLALDYLEQIENDDHLPRLVIMDLNMPILNGTQTLLQMKRSLRYRYIPVIIFSTSANEGEKRKCLSFGAIDYIVKPASYDEGKVLVQKFSSFIDSSKKE